MVDIQLGEFGEQEARSRLERALLAAGVRFSGASDKGLDLIVQFESTAPDRQPIHFAVQVKTGDSFASLRRGRWHIKNLDPTRFRQWTRSRVPVLFIWVRPSVPAECYWALVKRDSTVEHFTIARRALITPTIRFDLSIESARDGARVRLDAELLRPPLSGALRPYAKAYYRSHMLGHTIINPVVGEVMFTWSAWRHMTRYGRKASHIHQSLQLLPNALSAIGQVEHFRALRRLSHVVRGKWAVDTRLLAFRGLDLRFAGRAPASATVVLREQVWYPANWNADVRLHRHIRRVVTFHSIYEKVEEP